MAPVENIEQCNILNWCYSMCCSGVEYHYFVFLLISISMSYFIMVSTSITDMFMSLAIPFELQIYDFWNCNIILVLRSLTSQDVSASGHSFRILDWTNYHRTSYIRFIFSIRVFCRGVPCFATDCPCSVWCCGLTTCLMYVGPLFGNLLEMTLGL